MVAVEGIAENRQPENSAAKCFTQARYGASIALRAKVEESVRRGLSNSMGRLSLSPRPS
jgi:hypothetical protein